MQTLKERFLNTKRRNPGYSDYDCFTNAVSGQGFSKKVLRKWFDELVSKKDYAEVEKKQILEYLYKLSEK